MPDWIGYRWLAERYAVGAVQAFRTDSAIGKSRATVRENGVANARVVGDVAGVVLWHIQVGADEDTLTGHVEIGQTLEIHNLFPSKQNPRPAWRGARAAGAGLNSVANRHGVATLTRR